MIGIDLTHSTLDKLPIYAAFGIPGIWRYAEGQVTILVLGAGANRAAGTSTVLSLLTATDLPRLAAESRGRSKLDWLCSLRSRIRAQR